MINPFDSGNSVKSSGEATKPTAGLQDASDIVNIFDQEDTNDDKGDKDKKPDTKEKDDKKDVIDDGDDIDDEDAKKDDSNSKEDEDDEDDDKSIKLKEDSEDEDEEKLDLKAKSDDEIRVPPKKKEILAKYPDFFKQFPAVEKMIYRDKQMMELFGTFDNARDVAAKSEQFNAFESQLLSGSTEEILKVVKETDSKAYDKIVDNYLDVLEKSDEKAFKDVTGNYFKRVIKGMVNEANENQDKDLHEAAKNLYKYLFNSTKWEEPKNRVEAKEDDASKALKVKEEEFNTKQLKSAATGLQTKVDNVLRSTIADHIDPNRQMSAFEKKKGIDDCLNQLHTRLGSDRNLTGNLAKLWKAATQADFSNTSLDSIRKTYLGKSRIELESIIKSVRNEILKDKPKHTKKEDEDKEDPAPSQSKKTVGRPNQQTPKAKDRQKGESIEDYLARD